MSKTFTTISRAFAATLLASAASLSAQIITFDSNESVELESGWVAFSQPSGFTAAEQASIMQRVNAKLQAAGINLTASIGNSGPCRIIVSDSQAPPITGVQGNETDIGAGDGEPAIIFMAEHPDVPDYQHVDDIANSIKALIAAKHGAGANYNALASAMTQQQGSARFTDLAYDWIAGVQLQLNAGVPNAMTEKTPRPTDVRYRVDSTPGRRLQSFDVQMTYQPGQQFNSRFGHLRHDGTFVAFGVQGTLQYAPASFFFDRSGVDFAIKLQNGTVHSLSNGHARVFLQNPNPNNFDVFDRIDVQFDVNADNIADATIQVEAQNAGLGNNSGGFYTNVYPGTGEDLFLTGSVNINAAWQASQRAQVAQAGDVFYSRIRSFEGQFDDALILLVAEPFVSSSPIDPIPLPGVQVSSNFFLLQVGVLGPAGLLGSLPVPFGWSGYSMLLQGYALSDWAGNGLFGASDAMTLTFL